MHRFCSIHWKSSLATISAWTSMSARTMAKIATETLRVNDAETKLKEGDTTYLTVAE